MEFDQNLTILTKKTPSVEAGHNNIRDCVVEDEDINENSHLDMATQSQKKTKTDELKLSTAVPFDLWS
jgi:hypothetical protein